MGFEPRIGTLSLQDKIANAGTFGFVGRMVSVAATQLCCCSRKVAIDNTEMRGYGCIPIQCIYKNKVGWIGPMG